VTDIVAGMRNPSPISSVAPAARRRPFLDLSATLVRRGYVCDYDAGERPLPGPDRVLQLGRPAFLPLSTIACVRTGEPVVSLTYDDGPDPQFTPGILDALAAHGARATFFVLVESAERHRQLITRMLAEGHEVGLHGIDHTRLSPLPLRRATALIRDGRRRLEQVAGRRITLFRPTYGAQTLQQYVATRALGLEVVIWSSWAQDWDGSSADVIAGRAVQALHHGGFLLLHDASGDGVGSAPIDPSAADASGADAPAGGDRAVDRVKATELMLAGMQERGYRSETVSQLLSRFPAVRTVWAERGAAFRPTG
jgi:peptidoglycan/xylan/chitin deacetylase (PgdA/CDA1 family)